MNDGKYLIISDVDGTFIDYDENLVQKNVDAVRRFIAAGHYFTFATGRFTDTLGEMVPGYEELMNVPGIFSNGAYLSWPDGREKLFPHYLDGRFNLKIVRRIESIWPQVNIRFTNDDGICWTKDKSDDEIDVDRVWHKVVVICDPDVLEEIRKWIGVNYPNMFRLMKSSERLLEWQSLDAGKGVCVPRLKEWIKDNLHEDVTVFCVGDYENDLEMLEAADVPCCPSSSIPEIKRICRVELCDCRDGAVADLVDRLLSGRLSGGRL